MDTKDKELMTMAFWGGLTAHCRVDWRHYPGPQPHRAQRIDASTVFSELGSCHQARSFLGLQRGGAALGEKGTKPGRTGMQGAESGPLNILRLVAVLAGA